MLLVTEARLAKKEEILGQLVVKLFKISVLLRLQTLVKEIGTKSSKDLENLPRNIRQPSRWPIILFQGQIFLLQESTSKMSEIKECETDDVTKLSQELLSNESEERLIRGQARSESQNLSTGQEE